MAQSSHTFFLAHSVLLLLEVNEWRTVRTRSFLKGIVLKERDRPLLLMSSLLFSIGSLQARPLLTSMGILPQKWRRQNRIKLGKVHTTAPTPPVLQRVQKTSEVWWWLSNQIIEMIALAPTGDIAFFSLSKLCQTSNLRGLLVPTKIQDNIARQPTSGCKANQRFLTAGACKQTE